MKFNNLFSFFLWHFISFPPVCHIILRLNRAAFVLVYPPIYRCSTAKKMMKFLGMGKNYSIKWRNIYSTWKRLKYAFSFFINWETFFYHFNALKNNIKKPKAVDNQLQLSRIVKIEKGQFLVLRLKNRRWKIVNRSKKLKETFSQSSLFIVDVGIIRMARSACVLISGCLSVLNKY